MKRILSLLGIALLYFCVATVTAQIILAGMLWFKGLLTEEKMITALAAVQGLLPRASGEQAGGTAEGSAVVGVSYQELVDARFRASLDLDLRETALDKGLIDLRTLEKQLKEERRRYDDLKASFDAKLAQLQQDASDTALSQTRETLEAMRPQLAKEQLLLILADKSRSREESMRDVVAIVRGMAQDKQKKLLAEFKTDQEQQQLHEIMREILLGTGDVSLIKDTRSQLEQPKP